MVQNISTLATDHVRIFCSRFCTREPSKRSSGMSLDLFQSIGLSEAKAKETLKNASVSATLEAVIRKVRK